jgi:hydroxymethylpyrimidine pyrophosphatase-like HAD family hydrolase
MIKYCGYGIAVLNANKEVIESAKCITSSNDEDDVVRFINKNLL